MRYVEATQGGDGVYTRGLSARMKDEVYVIEHIVLAKPADHATNTASHSQRTQESRGGGDNSSSQLIVRNGLPVPCTPDTLPR